MNAASAVSLLHVVDLAKVHVVGSVGAVENVASVDVLREWLWSSRRHLKTIGKLQIVVKVNVPSRLNFWCCLVGAVAIGTAVGGAAIAIWQSLAGSRGSSSSGCQWRGDNSRWWARTGSNLGSHDGGLGAVLLCCWTRNVGGRGRGRG